MVDKEVEIFALETGEVIRPTVCVDLGGHEGGRL